MNKLSNKVNYQTIDLNSLYNFEQKYKKNSIDKPLNKKDAKKSIPASLFVS